MMSWYLYMSWVNWFLLFIIDYFTDNGLNFNAIY
jgi:hypothetical protein